MYVDDFLGTGSDGGIVDLVISDLNFEFALKDLDFLNYFLSAEVCYADDYMYLSQPKYVIDLLDKYDMLDTKPMSTPMVSGKPLSKFNGQSLNDYFDFRKLVSSLQYLTLSLPDISFSVNKLCKFIPAPTDVHLLAAKRLLRYLKVTLHFALVFSEPSYLDLVC